MDMHCSAGLLVDADGAGYQNLNLRVVWGREMIESRIDRSAEMLWLVSKLFIYCPWRVCRQSLRVTRVNVLFSHTKVLKNCGSCEVDPAPFPLRSYYVP